MQPHIILPINQMPLQRLQIDIHVQQVNDKVIFLRNLKKVNLILLYRDDEAIQLVKRLTILEVGADGVVRPTCVIKTFESFIWLLFQSWLDFGYQSLEKSLNCISLRQE